MHALGEGRRVVCLGEPLVDFVCEQPVAGLEEAPAFVPQPGGSLANVASVAARFGAAARIVGGVGDDALGRWLRDRLAAEGVDVATLALAPGVATSHAFVAVSADGEPTFAFYGDRERAFVRSAEAIDPALSGDPGVLVVGSDTLIGADERELTMTAAATARDRGWAVLCDPNLRDDRWPSPEAMLEVVGRLLAAATVVKANAIEAARLTGVDDPDAAASALLGLGPEVAAVTLGPDGALLARRGARPASASAPAVGDPVDATGAGDCVAGVLAAALAAGLGPERLARALRLAVAAASEIVTAWGALTALPDAAEARRRLGAIL
jgi:fructokinase